MVRVFWRFRSRLRPYGLPLVIGSLLVMLVAAADVAAPWPLKIIVDNVLRGKPIESGLGALLSPGARSNPHTVLLAALIALLVIVAIGAVADYLGTLVLDG